MAVLSLRDITHAYDLDGQAVPVLSGVSLDVEPGELVAIQGPSGSGKSTLLHLIGCLLEIPRGKLEIDGQDVSLLSGDELSLFRSQKIGFIF